MSNWEVSWPALQTVGAGWQAGPFSILLSEIMFSMVNRSKQELQQMQRKIQMQVCGQGATRGLCSPG